MTISSIWVDALLQKALDGNDVIVYCSFQQPGSFVLEDGTKRSKGEEAEGRMVEGRGLRKEGQKGGKGGRKVGNVKGKI
jgi:hypothetical protein